MYNADSLYFKASESFTNEILDGATMEKVRHLKIVSSENTHIRAGADTNCPPLIGSPIFEDNRFEFVPVLEDERGEWPIGYQLPNPVL